eukprot:m.386572 g.386572  ORF g.386572 m.386572 type:complete len:827 (-) comp56302_c0_seq3:193-2673(-)
MDSQTLAYARSCDLVMPFAICLKRTIGCEGLFVRTSVPERGVGQSVSVTAHIESNSQRLGLPLAAPLTPLTHHNEWLTFPLNFCDIPRNASLHLTLSDQSEPGVTRTLGTTKLPLYASDSTIQQGLFTLKVEGPLSTSTDESDRLFQEASKLQTLVKKHANGEMPPLDWLDALSLQRAELLQERLLSRAAYMYVVIELPRFDVPIVYAERSLEMPRQPQVADIDPEFADNLVENKHHKLTRSNRQDALDRELKPNPKTRDLLAQLTARPPTEPFHAHEKDVLWKFRFYLSRDKQALAKFLRCVDWSNSTEEKQAIDLLYKWEQISTADALELLSAEFINAAVRKYAVSQLEKASAEDLMLYLLQLVQALRFEPQFAKELETSEDSPASTNPSADGEVTPDVSFANIAPLAKTEPAEHFSHLEELLRKRAASNTAFASNYFWYLYVECFDKNAKVAGLYSRLCNNLISSLHFGGDYARRCADLLKRQHAFVDALKQVSATVKAAAGSRIKKIEILQKLLTDSELAELSEPLSLPLNPEVFVTGVNADTATLFKSALMPMRLQMQTTSKKPYTFIFKSGDDVRQDQLVIQIITLIDQLLKKENLDLKLMPYRVLAASTTHGMVEFIPSSTVASVLADYGSIQNFLRKSSFSEEAPYQIQKDVMDTYIKSCAGYCVITYILGVGDRHLDNLLLCQDGHLFHIDFGFILGRDPKPYPPPMKLSKDMIDAMGGTTSEEMKRFRTHCFNAFLILRKHANLILNLFSLMLSSSVADIALDPDKTVMKVQEKFRLDLNDEQVVKYFQTLLEDSVSALFPLFVEKVHQWAQYWRK